jgi:hypothetical protein
MSGSPSKKPADSTQASITYPFFCKVKGKESLLESFLAIFQQLDIYKKFKECYDFDKLEELPSHNSAFKTFWQLKDLDVELGASKATKSSSEHIIDFLYKVMPQDSSCSVVSSFIRLLSALFKLEKYVEYIKLAYPEEEVTEDDDDKEPGFGKIRRVLEEIEKFFFTEDDRRNTIVNSLCGLLKAYQDDWMNKVPNEIYDIFYKVLSDRCDEKVKMQIANATLRQKRELILGLIKSNSALLEDELANDVIVELRNILASENFLRDDSGKYTDCQELYQLLRNILIEWTKLFMDYWDMGSPDDLKETVFSTIENMRNDLVTEKQVYLDNRDGNRQTSVNLERYFIKGMQSFNVLETNVRFDQSSNMKPINHSFYRGNKLGFVLDYKYVTFKAKIITKVQPDTSRYKELASKSTDLKMINIGLDDAMSRVQLFLKREIDCPADLVTDFTSICLFSYEKHMRIGRFRPGYKTNKKQQKLEEEMLSPGKELPNTSEEIDFATICQKSSGKIMLISMVEKYSGEEDSMPVVFSDSKLGNADNSSCVIYMAESQSTVEDLAEYLAMHVLKSTPEDRDKVKSEVMKFISFGNIFNFMDKEYDSTAKKTLAELVKKHGNVGKLKLKNIAKELETVFGKEEESKKTDYFPGTVPIRLVCHIAEANKKDNDYIFTYTNIQKEINIKVSPSQIMEYVIEADKIYKQIQASKYSGEASPVQTKLSGAKSKSEIIVPLDLEKIERDADFMMPYYYVLNMQNWASVCENLSDFVLESEKKYVMEHKEFFLNYKYSPKGFILRFHYSKKLEKDSAEEDYRYDPVEIHKNTLLEIAEKFPDLYKKMGHTKTVEELKNESDAKTMIIRLRWWRPNNSKVGAASNAVGKYPYDMTVNEFGNCIEEPNSAEKYRTDMQSRIAWIIYEMIPVDIYDIAAS